MDIGGFRSLRMALGMSTSVAEDAPSATGDEFHAMAPPSVTDDPTKRRTDSASSAGSHRSSRSGRSTSGSQRRRRHRPSHPSSSSSRPPSQSDELNLPLNQDFVPIDGDDQSEEGAERARDDMREEVICAIFDLPRSTTFHKDFSCAIAAAFPMHGRMYPTSTHVCFYSNVFGRERKILIPYESITELSKTTTLVFQGAIRIKTASLEDYTFSSFWGTNRDRCFDLINEIRDRVSVVAPSEDIADGSNPGGGEMATATSETPAVAVSSEDEDHDRLRRRTVSDGGIVAAPRDTTMELLVDETFPISVDDFVATFIADDASFGHEQYNARIGTTEMQCNPWSARSEDESLGETRSMQFRVPIDSPLGPNSSIVDVLQCHQTSDHNVHTIETSTRLVDIPYGDYFSVEDRWTVVPHPHSPNECSLTIELKVVFSKSTFWKGQIESRAIADNKAKWLKWVGMARNHLRARSNGEKTVAPERSPSPLPPNARSSLTPSSKLSNGTPQHAAHCPEKGPPGRRPTGVAVEQRAVDSLRDRSRVSPRTQKSHRRVSSQVLPWIIIVILIWLVFRLNGTLTRMEHSMLSTEMRVIEIQQQLTRLHARGDVCR